MAQSVTGLRKLEFNYDCQPFGQPVPIGDMDCEALPKTLRNLFAVVVSRSLAPALRRRRYVDVAGGLPALNAQLYPLQDVSGSRGGHAGSLPARSTPGPFLPWNAAPAGRWVTDPTKRLSEMILTWRAPRARIQFLCQ